MKDKPMNILENAVNSIVIGLEDFSSSDQKRLVLCARNIFAGILLLFKYKLGELSPPNSNEALLKQMVVPTLNDGVLIWKGTGQKTVDVHNIQLRFASLKIKVDWKRFEKINKFRNEIEHYYSKASHESVKPLIADSFIIIRDFIHDHLNKDPRELLGNVAWDVLINTHDVYMKEKTKCDSALDSLSYFNNAIVDAFKEYSCDACGADLIFPIQNEGEAINSNFACKSCGKELAYENIVNLAVENYYSGEVYLSYKDGGTLPITECPECDGVYLYSEEVCSSCGYSAEHTCRRCGAPIIPEELLSEPYCGYCAHVMSKDD